MTGREKLIQGIATVTVLLLFIANPVSAQNPTQQDNQKTSNSSSTETQIDIFNSGDGMDTVRIEGIITGPDQSIKNSHRDGNWRYESDEAYLSFPAIYINVIKKVPLQEIASTQGSKAYHRRSLSSRSGNERYARQRVSEDISPMILKHAKLYQIDPYIIKAVIEVESQFNPSAISCSGACGLMQLKPGTAFDMGISNYWHPEKNIEAGTKYLRLMLDKFGDLSIALAAYNQGPGAVERAGGYPPNRTAKRYIAKVMNAYKKP